MRTELITNAEGWRALAGAWLDLFAACPNATPFQSPAWGAPWWLSFGSNEDLRTLATFDGDRLIGLAPLYVYLGERRGQIFLIGSGNTDHLDVLIAPGREAAVVAAWTPWLERLSKESGAIEFQQLRPGATWRHFAPSTGCFAVQDASPLIVYEDVRRSVPLFKAAAYEWRRAARQGALTVDIADQDTADEHFANLVGFHSSRWRARGEPGVLNDERTREFLAAATRNFASAGLLHLTTLRFDGRAVATALGFTRGARAYLYLTGFDPAYARLSPSKLLMWWVIEDTARRGVTELDLLRGREAYKYRWGAVDRLNFRWVSGAAYRPAPDPTTTDSPPRVEPLSTEAG